MIKNQTKKTWGYAHVVAHVTLVPDQLGHGLHDIGGGHPLPRQLVLGHGPLIALHPALHIARAEQRPAAEETLLIKHRKYLRPSQLTAFFHILIGLQSI